MEILDIKEEKLTPKVYLDPEEKLFTLAGSSLPENVHDFFQPIIRYLDEYEKYIEQKKVDQLKVVIQFSYYNSGSMRYIADIFTRLARFIKKGTDISVDWIYDKDDELLKEAGQDLADLVGMEFNFITS